MKPEQLAKFPGRTAGPIRSDDIDAAIAVVSGIKAVPTILDVICRATGMGFAAVACVTDTRWVACDTLDLIDFGLKPGGELKIETTICNEIKDSRQPVIINHVTEDAAYCGHPTPAMYGFQSYISMPITLPDGSFFGTLCAIDRKPARLNTPEVVGMFRLFAELIATHMAGARQLALTEASLLDERGISALREQFIAVLGHDLRNPLAAINSGMNILSRTPLNDKAVRVVGMVKNSVSRMGGLIDNVLDFARGRLGGGLTLERVDNVPLGALLDDIVAELQTSWPERIFETSFALSSPINCDPRRMGQLVSNLLANAITYGTVDTPVRLTASSGEGVLKISVGNAGEPIPVPALKHLFRPFTRGEVTPTQQGLGLGLYICSEIARAHDGELSVTSSTEETCFTFWMPLS